MTCPPFLLPNYKPQPIVDGKIRNWGEFSYSKLEKLGIGKSKICWKAQFNEGEKAVVKEVFKRHEAKEILHYTRVIAALNGHPNVVNVEGWFWSEQRKGNRYKFYQIQPCYENNLVVGIDEGIFETHPEWLLSVFLQLADGLAFIHSKGVTVRDVKLDNIFFEIKTNMIHVAHGDFGGADLVDDLSASDTYTNDYCSPSRLEDHNCTPADDVFSLGLCFAMIQQPKIRRRPFPYITWRKNPEREYGEEVENFGNALDESPWKSMIRQMLAYERCERPSAKQIKEELVNLA